MNRVKLPVSKAFYRANDNRMFLVCPSTKFNQSGSYGMPMSLFTSLATQVGCINALQLQRNIKGATVSFDAIEHKKGDKIGERDGKPIVSSKGLDTFTEDGYSITNFEIELSEASMTRIENAVVIASEYKEIAKESTTNDFARFFSDPTDNIQEAPLDLVNIDQPAEVKI